jgi:hypothetical protein
VLSDGSVIAQGPGKTIVSVVVGNLVTHSTVVVQQKVAKVEVGRAESDSLIVVAEGTDLQLVARGFDARGNLIGGLIPAWHVDDNTVASLDSAGVITGKNAGRTVIAAKIDGVAAKSWVSVVTPAAAIALVAGSSQRALAGRALAQAVVVRATNRRGAAASGKRVTFRLGEGQGAVEPASAVTDADGRARTNWTLGLYPGRQTLLASVENVDSALAIQAEADPVAANTRVAALADSLSGHAGQELADTVSIRVTDSAGRVLGDIPVRWSVLDGGSIQATDPRTDSLGIARARWTLSKRTGLQRVRAQVGAAPGLGIPPVTISAAALAGSPTGIVVSAGNGQRAAAGAELPKALVLKVVDENGSGVSGALLALAPSGGTLVDSALTADSLGYARTRWTMGHSAGEYTLAVHVDGVKQLVKLVAHAVPAAPANLAFDDVPGERHQREPAKAKRLIAIVTDVYGNPVPDARVNFSVKSGTVTPSRTVSDAKGRASLTWKLGTKAGEQMLTGTVRGTDVTGDYLAEVSGREPLAKAASLKAAAR